MQTEPANNNTLKRILIVEDDNLSLKLINDIIEIQGYIAITTSSGNAVIELARQLHPDLILLDIRLPDVDGTEVARRLKVDMATCCIPIIAVTACAMKGDKAKILKSGCDDYVSKPIDVRSFISMLERYTKDTP
jgi:two-component system, cell cycle response regulator DivK